MSLVSCVNLRAPATQTSAGAAKSEWRLVFRMSGGFAGFNRELELTNTGSARAIDHKRNIETTVQATARELDEINTLVSDLKPIEVGPDAKCRDCLEYSLDLQINGRPVAVRVSDSAPAGSKLQNLIRTLTNLLNRILASPAPQESSPLQ
jgi:hypothetical protein